MKADLEKSRVEEAELESQQSAAATEALSQSTSGPSGKACSRAGLGTHVSSVPTLPGQAEQAASPDSKRVPSAPCQFGGAEPLPYRKVLAESPKYVLQK